MVDMFTVDVLIYRREFFALAKATPGKINSPQLIIAPEGTQKAPSKLGSFFDFVTLSIIYSILILIYLTLSAFLG
jgi:hypothetical protein